MGVPHVERLRDSIPSHDVWVDHPVIGIDLPAVEPCSGEHTHPSSQPLGTWRSPGHDTYVCPQCDGRHTHHWVHAQYGDPEQGTSVRCLQCGAHKCGTDGCLERVHHLGPCLNAGVGL